MLYISTLLLAALNSIGLEKSFSPGLENSFSPELRERISPVVNDHRLTPLNFEDSILTDVKFSERRRGYDPEEVDNFLERVSDPVAQLQDKLREATARAEEADTACR